MPINAQGILYEKENRIPFIGVFLAAALSYVLIYFLLADLYARLMDVSRDTAYDFLVTELRSEW